LIVADHDAIDWSLILPHAPIVVDTRNVLAKVLSSANPEAARI
jgi:UDP-N-acetyl-D-mannosaminuronate dehydrogenase